jgi:hypothetical protein
MKKKKKKNEKFDNSMNFGNKKKIISSIIN